MRFRVEQRIAGPVDVVARAFTEPGFYELVGDLPKLGKPEVLSRVEDGDVVQLRLRYRFTGHLSGAVRRVLDPNKLTWVEESRHDLGAHRVEFRMVPDHYGDRFRCSGTYLFEALDDNRTRRIAEGDLTVKTPFVGRIVEQAIVSGLREHLDAEAPLVERYVAQRDAG